jgi:uncharacterized membrane protein
MKSDRTRSLLKTLTWRVVATSDTFLIAWLITGKLDWAAGIAGIEIITKMFLYYFHERIWDRVKYGRRKGEEHTIIFPYIKKRSSDSVWPYKD